MVDKGELMAQINYVEMIMGQLQSMVSDLGQADTQALADRLDAYLREMDHVTADTRDIGVDEIVFCFIQMIKDYPQGQPCARELNEALTTLIAELQLSKIEPKELVIKLLRFFLSTITHFPH